MLAYWIRGMGLLIAILTFGVVMTATVTWQPVKLVLRTYEQLEKRLQKSRNGILDYEKMQEYLNQNGATYHFGHWVGPISYTVMRILAGSAGFLLGSFYELWIGVIAMILFYLLPDLFLSMFNSKDNEKMLTELKLVYHGIAIQIRAGVYITDALTECYGIVRNERLRDALLTLSGEIAAKSDVEEALERFQNKFNNRYIDALCMTVLQTLESGQAVELLTDIGDQIKDMEATLMNRKKSSLDRSITFYQLGILAAVLVIVLYACLTHMLTAAIHF